MIVLFIFFLTFSNFSYCLLVFNLFSILLFLIYPCIVFQLIEFCSLHCPFIGNYFIQMKFLFNKNIINKWTLKCVLCVILKNISTVFTKYIQNAKTVIVQEDRNGIMKKIEKKYYYRNKTIDVYNLET